MEGSGTAVIAKVFVTYVALKSDASNTNGPAVGLYVLKMKFSSTDPVNPSASHVRPTYVNPPGPAGRLQPSSPTGRPTPEAKRLEYVREQVAAPSLRKFWLELRGESTNISYEAVRNYHFDRDAPVSYLKAIRQRYPQFSLSYLAGESDTPTEAHAQTNTATSLSGTVGSSTFSKNPELFDRMRERAAEGERIAANRRVATHRMWYEIREAMGVSDGGGIEAQIWASPHSHVPYWVPPLSDIRRRVWGRYMLETQTDMSI